MSQIDSVLLCISSCKLDKSGCVQPEVNGILSNIQLVIVSARSDVCSASNSTLSDMFIESTSTAHGNIIWNGFNTSDDKFIVADMPRTTSCMLSHICKYIN